jgi:hypothetical protein
VHSVEEAHAGRLCGSMMMQRVTLWRQGTAGASGGIGMRFTKAVNGPCKIVDICFLLMIVYLGSATGQTDITFSSYTESEQLQCILKQGDMSKDPLSGVELAVIRNDSPGSPFYPARVRFTSANQIEITRLGTISFASIIMGGMALNPVIMVLAVITGEKTLYIVHMNSGEQITTMDVKNFGNLANLQFDYRTQKLYGQYWDDSEKMEYFVNIDYLGSKTVRKIAKVNLKYKMGATRAIDYYLGIFYLIADDLELVGLNISTGNEIVRKTLTKTIGNGGIFFDGASRNLKALCRPFQITPMDLSNPDFALCSLDSSTGVLKAAVDSERIRALQMSDNALDSARQIYFFSGSVTGSLEQNLTNFGLFAFHSDTGKRIGGPFKELTDTTGIISMTVIPKCQCCKVQSSRRRESWEQLSFLFNMMSRRQSQTSFTSCTKSGISGGGIKRTEMKLISFILVLVSFLSHVW